MHASSADPSILYQRREDRTMLLLMTPALVVIVLLLVVPLAWLSWQSIWNHGFTLENYRRIFTGVYLDTFLLTFKLSLIVTAVTLLLGYPVAYLAASVPPKVSALILGMVILPFWTSVLVRTYAWLVLLQRTGVVNKSLMASGIIDHPLQLAYNQLRHGRRHGAYLVAVHGAAALFSDAENPAEPVASRRESRRLAAACIRARVPAVIDERGHRGRDARFYPVSRLLHHARTDGRRQVGHGVHGREP